MRIKNLKEVMSAAAAGKEDDRIFGMGDSKDHKVSIVHPCIVPIDGEIDSEGESCPTSGGAAITKYKNILNKIKNMNLTLMKEPLNKFISSVKGLASKTFTTSENAWKALKSISDFDMFGDFATVVTESLNESNTVEYRIELNPELVDLVESLSKMQTIKLKDLLED